MTATEKEKLENIELAAEGFGKVTETQKQFLAGYMVGVLTTQKETEAKKIS